MRKVVIAILVLLTLAGLVVSYMNFSIKPARAAYEPWSYLYHWLASPDCSWPWGDCYWVVR